jgi:hypothetical protein
MRSRSGAIVATVVLAACGSTTTPLVPTTSASPTPSAAITRPVATQEPLAPPTYVRWAVERAGGNPTLPYVLEFFFDGVATGFRIVDASGQEAHRVPIAGSGIFGPESCMVRARPPGRAEGATWIGVDAITLERFMQRAASYRVEADIVGGRTVTLPLIDSGCRAL